jgi:sortase A
MRIWRFGQAVFLLIGVAALGYAGWMYCDQFLHQMRDSRQFDEEREAAADAPNPRPAGPFHARLSIARLHLAAMVEEGVDARTLRHAAGHFPSTALPGDLGNVGVAAHRDTLFRALRGIRKHDRILISTLSADYSYEVTGTEIVNPANVAVLAPTPGEKTLTLITCYPFYFIGHSPKRFIVQARQVAETPQSGTDE